MIYNYIVRRRGLYWYEKPPVLYASPSSCTTLYYGTAARTYCGNNAIINNKNKCINYPNHVHNSRARH